MTDTKSGIDFGTALSNISVRKAGILSIVSTFYFGLNDCVIHEHHEYIFPLISELPHNKHNIPSIKTSDIIIDKSVKKSEY